MCIRCTFKREPNLYKPCGFVLGFLVSDANPVSCITGAIIYAYLLCCNLYVMWC
jgi:hypothetical protein